MKFKMEILTIFIFLSSFHFAHLNALDIMKISSLVSPKVLKCYKCSSLITDDCKILPNSTNKNKMVEECMPGAQGCVKQWIKNFDGKNATFRECYYGSISSLYTNFQCEGIRRDRIYDVVQCYKCRGDLCNKGRRLHTTFGILFYTLFLLVTSFILKM